MIGVRKKDSWCVASNGDVQGRICGAFGSDRFSDIWLESQEKDKTTQSCLLYVFVYLCFFTGPYKKNIFCVFRL